MIDQAHTALKWFQDRWKRAGASLRIAYVLLFVTSITGLAALTPALLTFRQFFAAARPEAQSFILVFMLIAVFVMVLMAWDRSTRVEQLKDENAQLKVRLDTEERKVVELEERWSHLHEIEGRDSLWKRECQVVAPPFVPRMQRTTRFLTVLNLKGGVGKTTLTANIAACLGHAERPLRVLLIDIDFQGTLSAATVDGALILVQRQNGSLVNHLLAAPEPDDALIPRLTVGMTGVPSAAVVLANDSLDAAEFELQARFFVDSKDDPRFRFRQQLHRKAVFDQYDLVVFDCAPRITTSVVNAMACSDYVLIPTDLDRGSIDAVPRTMDWMRSLGANCPAEVVGVVATQTTERAGKLVKADNESYEQLRAVVESHCGAGKLFASRVRSTKDAVSAKPGTVAGLTPDGRSVYAAVVTELRGRMQV
jgi:cellulose biosynthesis protein BcsQ